MYRSITRPLIYTFRLNNSCFFQLQLFGNTCNAGWCYSNCQHQSDVCGEDYVTELQCFEKQNLRHHNEFPCCFLEQNSSRTFCTSNMRTICNSVGCFSFFFLLFLSQQKIYCGQKPGVNFKFLFLLHVFYSSYEH